VSGAVGETGILRNELELQIIGLQRSGNHAVLAWIFQQFEKPVYFFNNVKHFGDPIADFQPLDLPNTLVLRRGKSPGRQRQLEIVRNAAKEVIAYSYENLQLAELADRPLVPERERLLGKSRIFRRVLIIRDFHNWLASRVRYHEKTRMAVPSYGQANRFIKMWIAYAREYVGQTKYLEVSGFVRVSYNRWASEVDYRLDLLAQLSIAARFNDISYVPDAGGGSSFDATAFSGRSSEMQTNDRWRYLENERFGGVLDCVNAHREEVEDCSRMLRQAEFGPPAS